MEDSSLYEDPQRFFEMMHAVNPTLPKPTITSPALAFRSTTDPDFQAIRDEDASITRSGRTSFYNAFLLPSLNLQDLKQPNNLLLFLHSRARWEPSDFVNADYNSASLGLVSQAIVPVFLNEWTMYLQGQHTPHSYGRLVSWGEDDDAFSHMTSGIGAQPGEGMLVMDIQKRKLDFLLNCAKLILHDVPHSDSTIPKQPPLKEDDLLPVTSERPSLRQEVVEAPYKRPLPFNLSRICGLVAARSAESEDHIWLLREDPQYFQETVWQRGQHRLERIRDSSGRPDDRLDTPEFWDDVLKNVVGEAYASFLSWKNLLKEVENVVSLQRRFQSVLKPGVKAPSDYEQAIEHLSYRLENTISSIRGDWSDCFTSSPNFRQHFFLEGPKRVASKGEFDYFMWLLTRIMMDDQVMLARLHAICDEIERVCQSDRKESERLTPFLQQMLSDLSLLGELERQIGLRVSGPRMTLELDEHEKEERLLNRNQPQRKLANILYICVRLSDKATPLERFSVPSRRATQASTRATQQAEKELDLFWGFIDEHCRLHGHQTLHGILAGHIVPRTIYRTPDWTEPVTRRTRPDDDVVSTNEAAPSDVLAELELRTEKTIEPSQPSATRQKRKTRGLPLDHITDPTDTEGQTSEDEKPAVPPHPPIAVLKKAYKTFISLFGDSTDDEAAREVPWSNFLSAMASVGFAIQKLDGSAWVFTPTNPAYTRSIIFHEPHPASKIGVNIARRIARRLSRAYNWSGSTFVRGAGTGE